MKTFAEVLTFMYDNINGFLATCGNDHKPHVRAVQFMMEDNGKLYFATSSKKDVSKQLKENPVIEYAVSTPDFSKNVRISGEVTFVNDLELNQRIMESFSFLKDLYKSPDNPEFEVYYLEHGTAKYWDFEGVSEQFDF